MSTRTQIDQLVAGAVTPPEVMHDWDEHTTFVGDLLRDAGIDTDDADQLRAVIGALIMYDVWTETVDPSSTRLVHFVAVLAHNAQRAEPVNFLINRLRRSEGRRPLYARWEVSFGRLPDDHPDVEALTVTVQAIDRDDAIVKARLAADRLNIHRPIDEVIACA